MNVSELKKRIYAAVCAGKVCGLFVFVVLLFSLSVKAQTYELPDSNLRKKLQLSYPFVMSGNLLNTNAAANMTGTLDLSNAAISNADGIQYFTAVSALNLNFNLLENIPELSALTQLERIFLSHNHLTALPSLAAFSDLLDFQVPYNNLTTLPSLSANTKLLNIYCQNNLLTTLPDISMLTELRILDIGENDFGQLPDLSPFTKLTELHVHRTNIDTIIGLSALAHLKSLYAWGNYLRDLSALNANTTLTLLQVFDNELSTLPVVSNKPLLSTMSVIRNKLTTEDLLPLATHSNFSDFDYHPQKTFSLPSINAREKDTVLFVLPFGNSSSGNVYQWYKDNQLTVSGHSSTLTLMPTLYADSGKYHVQITNPNLPGLVLYSDTATLTVKACLELIRALPVVIAQDCREGTLLHIENILFQGGHAPIKYGLLKNNTTDTLFQSSPQFQSVSPGGYTFFIQDARQCRTRQDLYISPPEGCEAVFSPNGDGIADTYYIAEPGIARIYDLSRRMIRQLATPGEWDGTKADGTIAEDGYYAIVINEKKLQHVTLVK
jgi:internalin A